VPVSKLGSLLASEASIETPEKLSACVQDTATALLNSPPRKKAARLNGTPRSVTETITVALEEKGNAKRAASTTTNFRKAGLNGVNPSNIFSSLIQAPLE
jgi:hypothetical protein